CPGADVNSECLVETRESADDRERGKAAYANVVVGNRVAEKAAWSYADALAEWPERPQCVVFSWDAMDHWYEEAEEVIRHARDPYHRVDVAQSDRHVKVVLGGQVLADTNRPRLLFET